MSGAAVLLTNWKWGVVTLWFVCTVLMPGNWVSLISVNIVHQLVGSSQSQVTMGSVVS